MSVPRSLSPVLRAAIVLSMLTAVLLFPQMSRAAGFNTCIVPQQGLAVRQGVERPLSRDFDKVCVAVLPPTCRFQPSCSAYAITALRRYGAWKGGWLAVKRVARCHPWGGYGPDPVP